MMPYQQLKGRKVVIPYKREKKFVEFCYFQSAADIGRFALFYIPLLSENPAFSMT